MLSLICGELETDRKERTCFVRTPKRGGVERYTYSFVLIAECPTPNLSNKFHLRSLLCSVCKNLLLLLTFQCTLGSFLPIPLSNCGNVIMPPLGLRQNGILNFSRKTIIVPV